jgi:hypothetical protein
MKAETVLSHFVLTLACGSALAAPILPDFTAATFTPDAVINNPYFPLLNNKKRVFLFEDGDGNPVDERFELQRFGPGPVLMGVQTTTLRDRAYEEGLLVEDTFDFFAQDDAGNVWYMGEDVTNYNYDADGNLISTDTQSSWRAGVNGALPGFIMPALNPVGLNYYQEFAAADEALDQGLVHGIGLTLIFDGQTYTDVIRVFESSELSPNAREFKYYAPGIGLIGGEEGLDADFENPDKLFALQVPEPASATLLGIGLALLSGVRRRRVV